MYNFQRFENFAPAREQIINIFLYFIFCVRRWNRGCAYSHTCRAPFGKYPRTRYIYLCRLSWWHHHQLRDIFAFDLFAWCTKCLYPISNGRSPRSPQQGYRSNPIAGEYCGAQRSWHRHFNDLWRSKLLRKNWVFTRDRTGRATAISTEHADRLDRSIPAWPRNRPFTGVLHLRFGVKQSCHLVGTFHAIFFHNTAS